VGLRPKDEPCEPAPPTVFPADAVGRRWSPPDNPTSTERSARLEVRLTVPPGTDAGAACRALVHALARLAVARALAEEEPDACRGLRALLDNAPGR
jgi:hypothetical protein